jgi:thiol:disulfide interchange protein DsbC
MGYKRFMVNLMLLTALPAWSSAVEPEITENIEAALREIIPGFEATSIQPSKIDGLYEVMQGAEVLYVSGDGRYFLEGDLIDLKQRRNLTENRRALTRAGLLNGLAADEYIEFTPIKTEHTVYVFTDTECPYCQRFHNEIREINDLGVRVRYLAFPRRGEKSETYADMVSVWCSKDRNLALTYAKLGKKPHKMSCSNPVARQYHLGQLMGVQGTPAVFTENGRYIGGYLSPDELVEAIKDAY